nr:hypothetical protein Iba_chr04fCG14930 [Ipomoea batatas]
MAIAYLQMHISQARSLLPDVAAFREHIRVSQMRVSADLHFQFGSWYAKFCPWAEISRYAHLGNAYVFPEGGDVRQEGLHLGNAHLEIRNCHLRLPLPEGECRRRPKRVWETQITYILEPHFRNAGYILYSYELNSHFPDAGVV